MTDRMISDDTGKDTVATFGAGCYWGVEERLNEDVQQLRTSVGYTNGKEEITNPSYRQVCDGGTDYVEAIRIEFSSPITYAQLIEYFYRVHDPTIDNPRRNVPGSQYRSGIYTHSDEQLRIAQEVTDRIQKEHFTPKGKTIVTEILPAGMWYDAEDSHQKWAAKQPAGLERPPQTLNW